MIITSCNCILKGGFAASFLVLMMLSDFAEAQLMEEAVKMTPNPTPVPTPVPTPAVDTLVPLDFYTDYWGSQTTCTTYSMSQFGQNYETTRIMSQEDMWALHALQWKAYLHIATTGGTWDDSLLDINELEQQSYPFSQPLCNVPPDFLDSKEDISSGVYQDAQGNPVDPAGSWTCVDDNYPLDSVQSAVIAAMNMHYWGTPTYTDAFSWSLFPEDSWKVAIEQVTLCALGNQAPHEVCGWGNNWNDSYGSIESCTSILAFDSIKVGIFFSNAPPYFVPHQTLSSATWAAMYGAYGYDTLWNHLVFDPPKETSKEDIARLEEMAGRTAENMLIVQIDPTIKDDVWIGKASDLSEEVIGKRPSHAAHASKKDFTTEADHSEKVIGERPLH